MEPYFSILMNGTSKGFFKASKGLWQGDPLSPFLFSLVADGLIAILRKADEARLVVGFVIRHDNIMVSHLQFANDTILFFKAEFENVRRMELCMKIFKMISCLKVNLFKNNLVGIKVGESCLINYAGVMGCFVGNWPIKYWVCLYEGTRERSVFGI